MQSIEEEIKNNKTIIRDYKKYIRENDWTTDVLNIEEKQDLSIIYDAKSEFDAQATLVKGILDRITYIINKTKNHKRQRYVIDFVKYGLQIISIHTERSDNYHHKKKLSNLVLKSNVKKELILFNNHIFTTVSSTKEKISNFDINLDDDDNGQINISFLKNAKAPYSMHKALSKIYPAIQKKMDDMGIDFDSPPKNEMLITMQNIPKWDTSVHYWEQEKETLQFCVDEFKKLNNGIRIDGVYISGWAYYHINVFKANIPVKTWNETQQKFVSKDNVISPPLRDSDWMIFENRALQEEKEIPFMFIAASRRVAKTTCEASMLGHAATIGKFELLCAGSSARDLSQLAKNFKIDATNKDPMFAVPNATNDWEKKVELGLKDSGNKTILLSTLNIINTADGNNTEVFAGYTPDLVVVDEAMKSKFKSALEGIIPAMMGDDGIFRCYGILTGTGGDEELSRDGYDYLSSPETHETLPMQWHILERGVPEEHITWKEDRLKPFGTFIPGQCRVDMPKINSNLADYLQIDSDKLRQINIRLTDWGKAKELIEQKRELVAGDKIKLQKEKTYRPLTPTDIFLSGKHNRFPVVEAKAHKEYLLETGLWDRRYELYRDEEGKIRAVKSTKPLAEFPHKGGVIDAPFLLFEPLPTEKPLYGTYTAGFDDYASDDSDTASVATFYVLKNKILGDPFSEKIVLSLSFRPERHAEVWEKWQIAMEAFYLHQTCFGENFNYGIKDFLDRRHLTDKYLAPGVDFSASFKIQNNGKRKTGWSPNTSKKFLFDLFVEHCNEEYAIEDSEGNIKYVKGVQLIDDITLLDEIIQWSDTLNVDRITSMMGAYGYGHYLRSTYRFKVLNYRIDTGDVKTHQTLEKQVSMYSQNKKTFYKNYNSFNRFVK